MRPARKSVLAAAAIGWAASRIESAHGCDGDRVCWQSPQAALELWMEAEANRLWRLRQSLLGTAGDDLVRQTCKFSGMIPNCVGYVSASVTNSARGALIAQFGEGVEGPRGERDWIAGAMVVPVPDDGHGDGNLSAVLLLPAALAGEPVVVAKSPGCSELRVTVALQDALRILEVASHCTIWAAGCPKWLAKMSDTIPESARLVCVYVHGQHKDEVVAARTLAAALLQRQDPPEVRLLKWVAA